MKLWVDDKRREPEGWMRARSLVTAQACLYAHEFEEASLDHDLGDRGTGADLVLWMIDRGFVPGKITIHSVNPIGARAMEKALADAGHDCTLSPYRWKEPQ